MAKRSIPAIVAACREERAALDPYDVANERRNGPAILRCALEKTGAREGTPRARQVELAVIKLVEGDRAQRYGKRSPKQARAHLARRAQQRRLERRLRAR